jgi:hypothetical protein
LGRRGADSTEAAAFDGADRQSGVKARLVDFLEGVAKTPSP